MIDLAGMRSVRVDPIRRTARAEGGATWGDFDRESQAFSLATTGGSVSDTGIAGLTLGGGLGWLAGTIGGLLTSPGGEPVVAIAVCHNGSLEEGEKVLRPIKTFGPPLAGTTSR
jgi:hypothetical protein